MTGQPDPRGIDIVKKENTRRRAMKRNFDNAGYNHGLECMRTVLR